MEYSANSYFIFTFGCVGCVKLFRVQFSFKTEHPTRAFFFVTLAPGFGSFVHDVTARWRLGAYGRCLLPLGAYVIEPPDRGSLIVVLNVVD